MTSLILSLIIAGIASLIIAGIFSAAGTPKTLDCVFSGCGCGLFIFLGGLLLSAILWGVNSATNGNASFEAPVGVIILAVLGCIIMFAVNANAISAKSEKAERERQAQQQHALALQKQKEQERYNQLKNQFNRIDAMAQNYYLAMRGVEHDSLQKKIQQKTAILTEQKQKKATELLQKIRAHAQDMLHHPYPNHPDWPVLCIAGLCDSEGPETVLNYLKPSFTYLPDLPPTQCADSTSSHAGRNPLHHALKVSQKTNQEATRYYVLLNMLLAYQLQNTYEDGLLCRLYAHFMKLQDCNTQESVSLQAGSNHEKFVTLFTETITKWSEEFPSAGNAYPLLDQLPNTPYQLLERVALPADMFEPLVRAPGETK